MYGCRRRGAREMICRLDCVSCGSDAAGRRGVLLSVAAAKLPPRQSLPHRTLSRTKVTLAAGIQVNSTAPLTPITTSMPDHQSTKDPIVILSRRPPPF